MKTDGSKVRTMIEKKCKMCGDRAEWKLDGDCYCEFCARTELDVHSYTATLRCEMCGNHLDRVYYTDSEDNLFCSAKCALEYNDAKKLVEEEEKSGDE